MLASGTIDPIVTTATESRLFLEVLFDINENFLTKLLGGILGFSNIVGRDFLELLLFVSYSSFKNRLIRIIRFMDFGNSNL